MVSVSPREGDLFHVTAATAAATPGTDMTGAEHLAPDDVDANPVAAARYGKRIPASSTREPGSYLSHGYHWSARSSCDRPGGDTMGKRSEETWSTRVNWAELETSAPELSATGRRLLEARGGEAMLSTVRGDDPPRIHPVNVGIVDGWLYVFVIARSPKRTDLETDGRYALHTHVDPLAPDEFSVRGRATLVTDAAVRARVGSGWAFEVDDGYTLFELSAASALVGQRAADEWPPRYLSWRATDGG